MLQHLLKMPDKYSSCETTQQCPECCATIHSWTHTVKKGHRLDVLMRHRCGMGTCYNCGFSVMVDSHKCYIQHVDPAADESKKKRKKKAEEGEESSKPITPPLFVYADYKAVMDNEGVQTLIMVYAETEDCDDTAVFYGEECTKDLFNFLDNLTITSDGGKRKVIVIFHNFQEYHSMFIQQYLHRFHREVTNQITVGAKVLSLTSRDLVLKRFPLLLTISSLCFSFYFCPH